MKTAIARGCPEDLEGNDILILQAVIAQAGRETFGAMYGLFGVGIGNIGTPEFCKFDV